MKEKGSMKRNTMNGLNKRTFSILRELQLKRNNFGMLFVYKKQNLYYEENFYFYFYCFYCS